MATLVRPLLIDCAGSSMAAVLNEGGARGGILLVSGGLQTRAGPHRLFTDMASELAGLGWSSLRYDRCGIGDSDGADRGFAGCRPEMEAAVRILHDFRLPRVVGFGLCDGAASLALFGGEVGITDLVLLNPWSFDTDYTPMMPASAQRGRMLRRLFNFRTIKRLVTGKVDIVGALRGLVSAKGDTDTGELATSIVNKLNEFHGTVTIVLSDLDLTAQHFAMLIPRLKTGIRIVRLPGADHSLTRPQDRAAVVSAIADMANPNA